MRIIDKLFSFLVCAALLGICWVYFSTSTQLVSNEGVKLYGSGRMLGLVVILTYIPQVVEG